MAAPRSAIGTTLRLMVKSQNQAVLSEENLMSFGILLSPKKSYGYGKLMNACGTQAIVIELDSWTGRRS